MDFYSLFGSLSRIVILRFFFQGKSVTKPLPGWCLAIGICLSFASLCPILGVGICRITGCTKAHTDYTAGSPLKRIETNASTHPMMAHVSFTDLETQIRTLIEL